MSRPEYQNPLAPLNFPDPAAIKFRGEYFAYATGEAVDGRIFPIMTSPDAVHWTFRHGAMPPLPDPAAQEYWAPEVAYHDGLFYLYYAVIAFGTPEHHLRVAISASPLGPFEDQGLNMTPDEIFAIDAHPFQDDDGQWYLFYARDYLEPPFVGTGNAVDRLVTMTSLSGHPARVLRPYAEWQLFERQRVEKGGMDWYTVEGPFTLKRRGQYFCLYSGGCWKDRDYGVAYAVSAVPMGPGGLDDMSYRDEDNRDGPTLLRTIPGEVIGPGHNSVVKAPNNVAEWMVYHGWPPDPITLGPIGGSGRLLRIDRLEWHAGKPFCAGPTLTPQSAPPMPQFADRFDRPDGRGLGDGWEGEGGQPIDDENWHIQNGEAVAERGVALVRTPPRENYLFEGYVRRLNTEGDGSAGVIAADIDGRERLTIALGPDQITLQSRSGSPRSAPVPAGFRPDVYHQLLVERNAGRVRVRLDGQLLIEGDYAPGPARVGLWSDVPAAFDGIAVTAHFADHFDSGEARGWWAGQHSHWAVRDDALMQPESTPGRHEIAKGEALADWELNADLQFLSAHGAAGIVVRPVSGGALIEAALIRPVRSEEPETAAAEEPAPPPSASTWLCRLGDAYQPLPPTFDPALEHHLRLEKWADRLSMWLDGQPVAVIEIPTIPSRFALFTDAAAAAFRDVSFTGLA
jgi:GH43 family beta-xylosidase